MRWAKGRLAKRIRHERHAIIVDYRERIASLVHRSTSDVAIGSQNPVSFGSSLLGFKDSQKALIGQIADLVDFFELENRLVSTCSSHSKVSYGEQLKVRNWPVSASYDDSGIKSLHKPVCCLVPTLTARRGIEKQPFSFEFSGCRKQSDGTMS